MQSQSEVGLAKVFGENLDLRLTTYFSGCEMGEEVYPDGHSWTQGCYHYTCDAGMLGEPELVPTCKHATSRTKNIYTESRHTERVPTAQDLDPFGQ